MTRLKECINSFYGDNDGHVYIKYVADEINLIIYSIVSFVALSAINGAGIYSFILDKSKHVFWSDGDVFIMILYGIPVSMMQLSLLVGVFVIIDKIDHMKLRWL